MIVGGVPLFLKKKAAGGGLPNDYLFHYTMDNVSGTTVVDEGGTYDATNNGCTFSAGIDGNAAFGDGVADYFTVPGLTGLPVLTSVAISLWFFISNDGKNRIFFAQGGNSDPDDTRFIAQVFTDDNLYFDLDNLTTGRISFAFPSARFGLWNHFIGNYDGSTLSAYLNGNLEASLSVSGLNLDFIQNLDFLRGKTGSSTYLYTDGAIDQVRLFDRALTSEEITSLASEF